ncbi:hypothetical protein [Paenibacillus lutrae]|uniref:Core-binding (CB) domain-containing protein n=1 Tax=Paenibacillus lutrae TaxID=2078573 RepID=A0A7X3FIS7_9BACL|nr:hypothetical protein [Paenibacillus lutrae]MVP00554.1 hypothetical protein [Paenibacillus lutrae]
MGKASFPKELTAKEIESNNKNWIDQYKAMTDFDKGYYQKLENFFKFHKFTNKPFNLFVQKDVEEYIKVLFDNDYAPNLIDSLISHLSSFKNFLIEQYPDNFNQSFLNNILSLKIGTKEKKYAESRPLTYKQLVLTKQYIKSNIKTEYIFQVFYQLGIDKKNFHICSLDNVVEEEHAFVKDNILIKYNSVIEELLTRVSLEPNFKATSHMITDHLRGIQTHLSENNMLEEGQTLTYNDIIKSHKRFFFICPHCDEKRENLSFNWALVKTNYNNEMQLFCSSCKGQS